MDNVNDIFAIVALYEFLCYGVIICSLLFLLANVSYKLISKYKFSRKNMSLFLQAESTLIIILNISYCILMFTQLFFLYFFSNTLLEESKMIGYSLYQSSWYRYPSKLKKYIYLFLLGSERPLFISIGYIYPMTLETFQSVINAAYTFYTVLKRMNE